MVDGAEGIASDRLLALTFSSDSRRLAAAAGREKPGLSDNIFGSIIVDGKEGPSFEGEGWRERTSGVTVFLAGKMVSVTSFKEQGPIVDEYTYSTGRAFSVTARTTTKYIRLSPLQFGISVPVFSPDGARIAYAARRASLTTLSLPAIRSSMKRVPLPTWLVKGAVCTASPRARRGGSDLRNGFFSRHSQ